MGATIGSVVYVGIVSAIIPAKMSKPIRRPEIVSISYRTENDYIFSPSFKVINIRLLDDVCFQNVPSPFFIWKDGANRRNRGVVANVIYEICIKQAREYNATRKRDSGSWGRTTVVYQTLVNNFKPAANTGRVIWSTAT